jgi:hypothetical protein
MSKRDMLSNEFKVASQIYECNTKGEKVWFNRLADLLKDTMSSGAVHNALKVLFDWSIVKAEYGPTEKNRAGRLLLIANESKPTIKEIYENYWRLS